MIVQINSRSHWSAVKIAKDKGLDDIPNNMFYKDTKVPGGEVANCFANYFEEKVEKIVKSAIIDPMVYNGKTKFVAAIGNFISQQEILECVKQ